MEIKIELAQTRFILQESMLLRVVLRNTGSTPVDVPDPGDNRNLQPHYVITGPSFPKGHGFSFRSIVKAEHGAAAPKSAPALQKLAPGQTLEATLPLEAFVELDKPGRYTLAASVEVAGARADAVPLNFEVEAADLRSLALAIDDGMQNKNPMRVACLARLGDGRMRMYQALLHEERHDLGEVDLLSLMPVAEAPPAATEVLGVWTNHDRLDSLLNRFVWRSDGALGVEGLAGSRSLVLSGPALPSRVFAPALMVENGDVDVFGLAADGRGVVLTRFPPPQRNEPVRSWPAVAWAGNGTVLAGHAAVGPRAAANRRVAALLLSEANRPMSLQLFEAGAEGPTRQRSLKLEAGHALPQSALAVAVGADGSVRVSLLLAEEPTLRNVFVVDALFPAGDAAPTLQRQPTSRLPGPPKAAVVAYSVTPGTRRRDWLVQLQDGRVVFSNTKSRPRSLSGSVVQPLQLLPMSRSTYLLTLGERRLPQLELMF